MSGTRARTRGMAWVLRGCAGIAAATGLLATLASPASADISPGAVSVGWAIPGTPDSGLSNITFPLTVNQATAHKHGIYFAQQFSFAKNAAGYTGLQPRPNSGDKERMAGLFSVWSQGATSDDPNCNEGADGDPGISCLAEFDAVYGHRYDLKAERTGADTWTGTATDTVTGQSTHIGTWTLPEGSGGLQGSQGGFVEYYLGVPSCAEIPKADGVFGGPTTSDAGGLRGTSKANYEYGKCVGESGYHAEADGSGTHVTRGFGSKSAGGKTALTDSHKGKPAPAQPKPATGNGAEPQSEHTKPATAPGTGAVGGKHDADLAETGGDSSTVPIAAGGAVLFAAGGVFVVRSLRRRAASAARHAR